MRPRFTERTHAEARSRGEKLNEIFPPTLRASAWGLRQTGNRTMNETSHCLTPDRVEQLRVGESSPEELARIEQHLDDCPACRTALDEAAAKPDGWAELRISLSDGSSDAHGADDAPALEHL